MDRRRFLARAGAALATLPLAAAGSLPAGEPLLAPGRARLRDLGIAIGSLSPGTHNAITDVAGVAVGHATLISGEGPLVVGRGPVRTGVTAVLAREGNLARTPVAAADLTLNGNGELTGVGAVRRSGRLGAPVLFTDTGSIGPVYEGGLDWMLQRDPGLFGYPGRPEPVVGETWADFLHDTAGRHVLPGHAVAAIESARSGPVAEGCVGGGYRHEGLLPSRRGSAPPRGWCRLPGPPTRSGCSCRRTTAGGRSCASTGFRWGARSPTCFPSAAPAPPRPRGTRC